MGKRELTYLLPDQSFGGGGGGLVGGGGFVWGVALGEGLKTTNTEEGRKERLGLLKALFSDQEMRGE